MARPRVVFADASPLIALAATGRFELLRELFGAVTVTASVRREVLAAPGRPGERELRGAIRAGWIRVHADRRPDDSLSDLGQGEATTLAVAASLRTECLVLVDDPVARRRAQPRGLPIAGAAGILLIAKRRGLIPSIRPLLERMMAAEFRMSAELVATVLEEAGEARNR